MGIVIDASQGGLCRILGRGLGCVLIKSTLGSGKTQKGWMHGSNGEQRGTKGTVYKQPGTEVDHSCHSWRVPSKWKGVQRGVRRNSKGSKGKLRRESRGNCAMYICNCNVYVQE